jgi:CTP:molybdopterin cytidylyltransferase MocA
LKFVRYGVEVAAVVLAAGGADWLTAAAVDRDLLLPLEPHPASTTAATAAAAMGVFVIGSSLG